MTTTGEKYAINSLGKSITGSITTVQNGNTKAEDRANELLKKLKARSEGILYTLRDGVHLFHNIERGLTDEQVKILQEANVPDDVTLMTLPDRSKTIQAITKTRRAIQAISGNDIKTRLLGELREVEIDLIASHKALKEKGYK